MRGSIKKLLWGMSEKIETDKDSHIQGDHLSLVAFANEASRN